MIGTSGALTSTCALSMPRPGEGGQQVLDRRDARVAINKSGAELGVADVVSACARTSAGGSRSVRRNTMPVSGAAGRKRHQHLLAGVQADALGADGIFESALSEHLIASPAAVRAGARVAPPVPGTGGIGERSRHASGLSSRYSAAPSPKKGRYRNTVALNQSSGVSPPGAAERPGYPAHLRLPRRACSPSPTAR